MNNQYNNIQQLNQQALLIQHMFQFFTSFGASTNFQKYRLQITAKNLDAPSEQSLRNIANTFCGEDTETKSQIAYATIVKKLLTSDSKNHWIYVLKNLIILDRVVQENIFTEQISTLSIDTLNNFKDGDSKNYCFDCQRIIASYWRLVREKSLVLSTNKHIFCYKRSQRAQFLSKLNFTDILKQIQSIENFFSLTYDFVQYLSGSKLILQHPELEDKIIKGRQQFNKSKLMEYLCLQILQKLMLYYSSQLQCNKHFLNILTKQSQRVKTDQIKQFKRHIVKFKQNSNECIKFVEKRKHFKGFDQVNYKELNPYESQSILKILDDFMAQKISENKPIFSALMITQDQMRVQKKPFANLNSDTLIPRLKFRQKQSKLEQISVNSFTNWGNSFSQQFPQKQILSVDLIMQIKRSQQNDENEQEVIDESNRQSCIYNNRDINISDNYEITQKIWDRGQSKQLVFKNVFSQSGIKWNY